MGVLFGSHFLPYAWLYRSRGYGFLAIGTTVALCAAVLVTRAPLYANVPLIAAACYAVAIVLLWMETNPNRAARATIPGRA
jgi:hypothetical protein